MFIGVWYCYWFDCYWTLWSDPQIESESLVFFPRLVICAILLKRLIWNSSVLIGHPSGPAMRLGIRFKPSSRSIWEAEHYQTVSWNVFKKPHIAIVSWFGRHFHSSYLSVGGFLCLVIGDIPSPKGGLWKISFWNPYKVVEFYFLSRVVLLYLWLWLQWCDICALARHSLFFYVVLWIDSKILWEKQWT